MFLFANTDNDYESVAFTLGHAATLGKKKKGKEREEVAGGTT